MFDLQKALAACVGGGTIILPAGDHFDLRADGARFTAPVTIRGDAGAVLRSLTLVDCAGLVVEGLALEWTPTATTLEHESAVTVRGGGDVSLSGLKVRGHPALAGEDAGWPIGRGVYVEGATNVRVERCDITGFHRGVVGYRAPDLAIVGNDIHHNRATTIAVSRSPRSVVRENYLHSSKPRDYGGAGDHGDFVAIWNVAGDPVLPGPTVADNLLDQGDGDPIMGVMVGEAAGFENVQITGNVVLGGHAQAFLLNQINSGRVDGNLARRIGGEPKTAPGLLTRDAPALFSITNNHLGSIVVGAGAVSIAAADGNVYDQSEASAEELARLRAAWKARFRATPQPEPEPEPVDPLRAALAARTAVRLDPRVKVMGRVIIDFATKAEGQAVIAALVA